MAKLIVWVLGAGVNGSGDTAGRSTLGRGWRLARQDPPRALERRDRGQLVAFRGLQGRFERAAGRVGDAPPEVRAQREAERLVGALDRALDAPLEECLDRLQPRSGATSRISFIERSFSGRMAT